MIDVSVIIPVYNVEKYIERCTRSLFNQTLQNIEFIFVNDCSTDQSGKIIEALINSHLDIHATLINLDENRGVSEARIKGIKQARGKYIAFCDSDDWVESSMYEILVKTADSANADIVGCGFIEHKNGVDIPSQFKHDRDDIEQIMSFDLFGGIYGALWNKIIRKDFFIENDRQLWRNLTMWEDSCMLIPLRLQSHTTLFINECLYHYNVNYKSITSNYSLKKTCDAIEATRRLDAFFKEEGYSKQSQLLIQNLKIASKEVLLRFPSKSNINMFKSVFPEAKYYIWFYPNWNFILKIRAWLVMVLPLNLAFFVLKHMRK